MPISDDCRDLLATLCTEYSSLNAPTDRNFHQIFTSVTHLINDISSNPENYKDDRVIAILASSALLLNENPVFMTCCRNFIATFQQRTGALDSFVDRNLKLKDVSAFVKADEKKSNATSQAVTPFLRDLQTALTKLHKEKEIRETLERGHCTSKPYQP